MPDELETVLRLVADGHLRAEDAAPIIEALQARGRERRQEGRGGRGTPDDRHGVPRGAPPPADRPGMHALRIEVLEGGRPVVNLRIPLGLASGAIQRIPGLPAQYRESIREAIRTGATGSIVDVGEGLDRVRVVLE